MTGTSHIILGTALGITAAITWCGGINSVEGLCVTGGCIIGSLFPDFDSRASKISYRLPVVSFFLRMAFGHRSVLHTPFILIIFSILFAVGKCLFLIPSALIIGFMLGYLCHLLQDTVTKRGIMWLYPFSKKYFSLVGISSGKSMLLELGLSFVIYCVVGAIFGLSGFVFFNLTKIFL